MYRTDFWTLWDKVRVGYSERIALKQITSPGWMHETSAQGWCTGKTEGWDEEGGRRGDQDGEYM